MFIVLQKNSLHKNSIVSGFQIAFSNKKKLCKSPLCRLFYYTIKHGWLNIAAKTLEHLSSKLIIYFAAFAVKILLILLYHRFLKGKVAKYYC